MPSHRDKEEIEKYKEYARKGKADPAEISSTAKLCWKETVEQDLPTKQARKEEFWACLKEKLKPETREERKKKYTP